MPVKLYSITITPPGRAVTLTLKALNIPFEVVQLDFENREHRSEDYLKINPQGTIPTLTDDDFVVIDSHAINIYLVSKYARDDTLYPKDIKARSVIDHRLYFEATVLFIAVRNCSIAVLHQKKNYIADELIKEMSDGYAILEKFLTKSKYVAGNTPTIADFSVATTLSAMQVYLPIKKEAFPLLYAYYDRCESTLPNFLEITKEGIEAYKNIIRKWNPQFQLTK